MDRLFVFNYVYATVDFKIVKIIVKKKLTEKVLNFLYNFLFFNVSWSFYI